MNENGVPDIYRSVITLPCDLGRTQYDAATHTVHLLNGATLPPSLRAYAERNDHEMPEGIYGFFGENSARALVPEIKLHFQTHGADASPLWDLAATIELERQGLETNRSGALAWRNPAHMQAGYIRVGRSSKETNDLLRFFTGDRWAIDRLALEPWHVNTYAAVLQEVYGKIRAMIFNALMGDGRIETVIKILDPTVISNEGIRPLYRWLSAKDPDQPVKYEAPGENWKGWANPHNLLSDIDRADITAYMSQPKENVKTKDALFRRRLLMLRDEGRFKPREKELRELANRRLQNVHPKGAGD